MSTNDISTPGADSGSPLVALNNGEATTTTRIIAAGTANEHESVMRLLANNQADFEEFGVLRFEIGEPGAQGGRPARYALLNEEQATLLVTYLRNTPVVREFKKRLVRAFFELRARAAAQPALQGVELMAAGYVEAMKALDQRDARILQLEHKVAADAPKVGYIDQFVADEDLLKLRTVASNLGVQEKWLRDLLLGKKWIYAETTRRFSSTKGEVETITRYSAHADKKRYFRPVPVHEAPRFKGEVMHTLKVTPAGAEAINRLVAKEQAA